MEELYLLDDKLNKKHIIDTYSSLIWAKRYNDIGDFELMILASTDNFRKIEECKYIMRSDDDMVCEIKKIEIKTDAENGSQLIISGTDIKNILKQRIITKQINFNGPIENYIRTLIQDSIINPKEIDRRIDNFILDEKQGYTETIKEQATYDNVGEKIQKLCAQYEWGYKVNVDNRKFIFSLFKGRNVSEYITFSANFDNISTTDYLKDNSNIKNVALVAGEGEGVERTTITIGKGKGIDRHEVYFDLRDISRTIEYEELLNNYPNGREITIGNTVYYQVNRTNIAIIEKDEEGAILEIKLCDEIYMQNLKNTGHERLSEYTSVTSFSGKVITTMGYKYKKDYDLGDIVNIENEFGISVNARITEVIECRDENGYSIEPTFENVG